MTDHDSYSYLLFGASLQNKVKPFFRDAFFAAFHASDAFGSTSSLSTTSNPLPALTTTAHLLGNMRTNHDPKRSPPIAIGL